VRKAQDAGRFIKNRSTLEPPTVRLSFPSNRVRYVRPAQTDEFENNNNNDFMPGFFKRLQPKQ
jgi:hypothetical protein